MDTNKILSADFLDIIFDNRNKDYGAYYLRKTYQNRVTKSLVFTGLFVLMAFTGVVLANKLSPKEFLIGQDLEASSWKVLIIATTR